MKNIFEGFEVKDLENVLEPAIHIDEFKAKIGKDDKNIVISFLINDKNAAVDLVDFIERGYEFILDADVSSSEVKPGSYLVFIELQRRRNVFVNITKIIKDLSAASGLNLNKWKFKYMKEDKYYPLNVENFKYKVPLSPKEYRERFLKPLNDLQLSAGITPKKASTELSNDEKVLQHAAGIN